MRGVHLAEGPRRNGLDGRRAIRTCCPPRGELSTYLEFPIRCKEAGDVFQTILRGAPRGYCAESLPSHFATRGVVWSRKLVEAHSPDRELRNQGPGGRDVRNSSCLLLLE